MTRTLASLLIALLASTPSAAQQVAKYGADFLAGGVGAKALAMGGAHVAHANDVNSGYWNAAGLSQITYPEIAYMHVERFAGIVSLDYAAAAYPVSSTSTVALAFIRSGINDIKNTLNAWDGERNRPKANPESYIQTFSAADVAFYMSYARHLRGRFYAGISGKLIRRSIGSFADAWGYSFDAGAQWRGRRFAFGVQLQDVSTMLQSWSVNPSAFEIDGINPDTGQQFTYEEVFEQVLPTGETLLILPVMRLGSGLVLGAGLLSTVTLGMDLDVAFDGQQANAINAGRVSFHPRAGAEYSFRQVIAIRAGINRLASSDQYGLDLVPSVGAGLRLRALSVDYGFGDFGGFASELGYTHRISVQFRLQRSGFRRTETVSDSS